MRRFARPVRIIFGYRAYLFELGLGAGWRRRRSACRPRRCTCGAPAVELNATRSAGASTTALTQRLMIIARAEAAFVALRTAASTLCAIR